MPDLKAENDELRETVLQLRQALAGPLLEFPREWGLTRTERRYLRVLADRKLVSKDMFIIAVYAGEDKTDNALAQMICSLRKKLRSYEIEIVNEVGIGYYLIASSRIALLQYFPKMRRPA